MEENKGKYEKNDRSDRDEFEDAMDGGDSPRRRFSGGYKKKSCRFNGDYSPIDYKNIRLLQSFLTEHGKIVPRRITGNSAFAQRKLTREIKKARVLALVGFTTPGSY